MEEERDEEKEGGGGQTGERGEIEDKRRMTKGKREDERKERER